MPREIIFRHECFFIAKETKKTGKKRFYYSFIPLYESEEFYHAAENTTGLIFYSYCDSDKYVEWLYKSCLNAGYDLHKMANSDTKRKFRFRNRKEAEAFYFYVTLLGIPSDDDLIGKQ